MSSNMNLFLQSFYMTVSSDGIQDSMEFLRVCPIIQMYIVILPILFTSPFIRWDTRSYGVFTL